MGLSFFHMQEGFHVYLGEQIMNGAGEEREKWGRLLTVAIDIFWAIINSENLEIRNYAILNSRLLDCTISSDSYCVTSIMSLAFFLLFH